MRLTKQKENQVRKIIAKHRLVKKRVSELTKKGFNVRYCPVGKGGTGHIHYLKSELRLQIGYAKGGGYQNYAEAVIFEN